MKKRYLTIYLDEQLARKFEAYIEELKARSPMPESVMRSCVARKLLKMALNNLAQEQEIVC